MIPPFSSDPSERRLHDLFLSYHSADRDRVAAIKEQLSSRGVHAFLDRDDLVAGLPWPNALENALRSVRAVLVFVGSGHGDDSLGLWQRREAWFALDRQVHSEGAGAQFPVIPVLLPGARPDAGFLFLNTWVDLRDGGSGAAGLDAIVRAVASRDQRPSELLPPSVCPYRALEPFREEHASLYFGREAFADGLLERARKGPFVALIGPSGSGKSSVVQAGLIPLLRRQRPPERAWDIVVFRPGDSPFHRLAAALTPLLESNADEVDRLELSRKLGGKLTDGSIALTDTIDRLLTKSRGTDRLLIVADQFEELFTLTPAPQQTAFLEALLGALNRTAVTLVVTLRADFYAQAIAADRRLSDHIQAGVVNLGAMTRSELRRAVEQPARRSGIDFESGLVARMLDHSESQPGGLPLLEFALTQLWERRTGQRITHAAYDAIGEIAGAISTRAETVFQTLDEPHKRAASRLFTRLVRVAAAKGTEPDTRRRVDVDTVNELEHPVLQSFVDARLLVLNGGASARTKTVELAHEALLQGWERLIEWVDQQREFLLWRQRLGQSLEEWHRAGRNANLLWRGPALKEADSWWRTRRDELNHAETEFVRGSRKRHRRRRGWLALGAALAIILAGAFPAVRFGSQTNPAAHWVSTGVIAPALLVDVPGSVVADWVHAIDVADRLDELGADPLGLIGPVSRLDALKAATVLMAAEGRTTEARRLVERALAVSREIPNFESNIGALFDLSAVLKRAGHDTEARRMALEAVTRARQERNEARRAMAVADAAWYLAFAGLPREATAALEDTRAALAKAPDPDSRIRLWDAVAGALVQLGRADEMIANAPSVPGWTLTPGLTQLLVDTGNIQQAQMLAEKSDNPLVAAVLASAMITSNRQEEGRVRTLRALARLETATAMSPQVRDIARWQFYERLLLASISADEAAAVLRKDGTPDEMSTLAAILGRSGTRELAVGLAQEAAAKSKSWSDEPDRGRVMVKVTDALAASGRTDLALTAARSIDDQELQTSALAYVALGFASHGARDKTEEILRDVMRVLPTMRDRDVQSTTWATMAFARVEVGDYAAIFRRAGVLLDFSGSDAIDPFPEDVVRVATRIVRHAAIRRRPSLRDAFDRRPIKGMGRYPVHWP